MQLWLGCRTFPVLLLLAALLLLQVPDASASLTATTAPDPARSASQKIQEAIQGQREAEDAANRAASFAACLRNIKGFPEVRLPGTPSYRDYANGLRIIRWHSPAAVVYPKSVRQVQAAVLCAVKFNVQPIPRCGGNSFESLSSGDGALVIDLSEMAAVAVDVLAMTANVQFGARMGNVYSAIFKAGVAAGKNLTSLGGVWPQVGIGGLTAAGGYGSLSRKYGVLADHILSARVVDAQGRVLLASPQSNPDLYFAIRGGGGGTYGIVVEAVVKVIEVPVVTVAHIGYRGLDHALELMDRFQRWAPSAPAELTFTYNLVRAGSDIKLYYLGKAAALQQLMQQHSGLLAYPGAVYRAVECDVLGSRGWLAGSGWAPLACRIDNVEVPQRVTPGGVLMKDREASKYRSAIFTKPIPREGLQEIIGLLRSPEKVWKLFQWKAYGGAFDSIPSNFNAFPHRKGVIMHSEFGTSFGYQRAASDLSASQANVVWDYFARAAAVMDKYATGARYNGYVCLCDDVAQYFGPNYARLRTAKKKYDPNNVFRNALSVAPATGDTNLE